MEDPTALVLRLDFDCFIPFGGSLVPEEKYGYLKIVTLGYFMLWMVTKISTSILIIFSQTGSHVVILS